MDDRTGQYFHSAPRSLTASHRWIFSKLQSLSTVNCKVGDSTGTVLLHGVAFVKDIVFCDWHTLVFKLVSHAYTHTYMRAIILGEGD